MFATWSRYAGFELEDGVDLHDTFQIGSLTKSMTAGLILQLWTAGHLTLDEDVIERGTVDDLLSFRTSIHDPFAVCEFRRDVMYNLQDSAQRILDQPLGTNTYSNANYVLLAWWLEQTMQMPYQQLLQNWVLEPLGMYETSDKESTLEGHCPNDDRTPIRPSMSGVTGAAHLSSSIWDMHLFMTQLHKFPAIWWEPHTQLQDGQWYGYGWFIGVQPYHTGEVDGFTSYMEVGDDPTVQLHNVQW